MSNREYVRSVLTQKFTPISADLSRDEIVTQIADIIRQLELKNVATVSIIGGAASGKSTIAEELVTGLQKDDIRAAWLATDNYVVGDREYRQVKLKNADAQKKYDFTLMDKHIRAIRALSDASQTVEVPLINPGTGLAIDGDNSYSISQVEVLVIEGDFPRDDYDIRFYIHVPDDQRLQTNIEREVEQDDDIDAGKLTERFNDRQRTLHKPYTLPAMQSADYVLVADVSNDDWLYTIYQRT